MQIVMDECFYYEIFPQESTCYFVNYCSQEYSEESSKKADVGQTEKDTVFY